MIETLSTFVESIVCNPIHILARPEQIPAAITVCRNPRWLHNRHRTRLSVEQRTETGTDRHPSQIWDRRCLPERVLAEWWCLVGWGCLKSPWV
ncbi:hypothetical protein Hanom_Chr04g00339861 [Helianthus anomalus]